MYEEKALFSKLEEQVATPYIMQSVKLLLKGGSSAATSNSIYAPANLLCGLLL